MNNTRTHSAIWLLTLVFLLGSCGTAMNVPIKRGKINGDFSIQFTGRSLSIRPDEFFNLEENGLRANKVSSQNKLERLMKIKTAMKLFRKQKVANYDITITQAGRSKPYYGKIAFFKTSKRASLDAVARYYELTIGDSYFLSATRGRVAMVYEYSEDKPLMGKATQTPTWIMLLSDEPL